VPDERPVKLKLELDAPASDPPRREPTRWARSKWWFRQLKPILLIFATAVFTYVFVDCHTHKLDDANFVRTTQTEDRTFDASLLQQYMALDHDDYYKRAVMISYVVRTHPDAGPVHDWALEQQTEVAQGTSNLKAENDRLTKSAADAEKAADDARTDLAAKQKELDEARARPGVDLRAKEVAVSEARTKLADRAAQVDAVDRKRTQHMIRQSPGFATRLLVAQRAPATLDVLADDTRNCLPTTITGAGDHPELCQTSAVRVPTALSAKGAHFEWTIQGTKCACTLDD
jgi:hypothetical protein